MYYASHYRNKRIDFTAGHQDRFTATMIVLAIFALYFLASSLTLAK
jgi:hypothetical protein